MTALVVRLTRQGVRDLGSVRPPPKVVVPPACDHRRMRYCCHPKRCGHLVCRCGLAWDEGAEK